MSRIVLFGATGYTGGLAARSLAAQGARPVLAGRRQEALEELAGELGGLEIASADAGRPESVRALLAPGDVLVTTVGPMARWGRPALDAAIRADLPSLRIVHGKGTGALRALVADALKSDPRVKSFRSGTITEGGTGVTVAELR